MLLTFFLKDMKLNKVTINLCGFQFRDQFDLQSYWECTIAAHTHQWNYLQFTWNLEVLCWLFAQECISLKMTKYWVLGKGFNIHTSGMIEGP